MIKTVIKEITIVILLLIAVVLIMGIIFYDYIPNSKTVPVKIEEYALSEDVQDELNNSVSEGQNIVKTLYIGKDDLEAYESTNDYDKGKANPFADYSADTTESNTSNTTSGTSSKNTTTTTNSSNNQTLNNTTSSENTSKNEEYMTTPGKNY